MFCISDVESDIRQAAKVANEGEERNMKDALVESLREIYGLRKQEREIERERERDRDRRDKKKEIDRQRERERERKRKRKKGWRGREPSLLHKFHTKFRCFHYHSTGLIN